MVGTSSTTGAVISEVKRIRQAVSDILLTPIGSRVLRGDYGSLLFDLIDQPGNIRALQQVRAATVDALKKWEPSIKVEAVEILFGGDGSFTINIFDTVTGDIFSAVAETRG